MVREEYLVPGGGTDSGAPRPFQPTESDQGPSIQYLCGDCGIKLQLRRGEPIRCKECGCRVLYKERTKR